jgi:hypothetical protein
MACEVCAAQGKGGVRGKRVLVAERLVTLCAAHRRVLMSLPVARVDELQTLFRERGGRRSLVERRQDLDRRVFPRPEGRRRNGGRRTSDGVR